MAGIGIITNPHAKLNKKDPRRPHLLSYIAGERGHLEITQDLTALEAAAMRFKEKNISILAICGGDGTIHTTINAFIKAYKNSPLPKIAILGGGTINVLAENLGVKSTPEFNLFNLIESFSQEKEYEIQQIKTLEIKGMHSFLFASGTSATFLESFYKNKNGKLGAIFLVLKIIFSYLGKKRLFNSLVIEETYNIITKNSESIINTPSIFISTLKYAPLKVELFKTDKLWGKHLNLSAFNCKTTELPLIMPRLFLPKLYRKAWLTTQRAASFTLQSLVKKSSYYTLDGELYPFTEENLHINTGVTIEFLKGF